MSEQGPDEPGRDAPLDALDLDVEQIARVLEPFVGNDGPIYTLEQVARRHDIEPEALGRQWRALGFPEPRADEKVLSEWEAELLGQVVEAFWVEAVDEAISTHIYRVIASSLNRIASAQIDALVERAASVRHDPMARVRVARSSALMPRMLEFVWRRRLGVEVQRRLVRQSAASLSVPLSVGFADMVGFTAQAEQLDVASLAEVVERFEAIAYDVVPGLGGRVVKTIGDEVMFVNDDAVDCCRTALELAQRYREDDALSDVRVGLDTGLVLERDGDVFGHPVNVASRIVSVAFPGSVLVSDDIREAARDIEEFAFATMPSQFLRDIGQVTLWRMRRADDPVESALRTARLDLAARRQVLDDRWGPQRREALERAEETVAGLGIDLSSLPERLVDVVSDTSPESVAMVLEDPERLELEALGAAVLRADLATEAREDLLTDLGAARALRELQVEVESKAAQADSEAENRLRLIEREMAASFKALDKERRQRVAEILEAASVAAAEVDEQAAARVREVADEANVKAEEAGRTAREKARSATELFGTLTRGDGSARP